MGNQRHQPCLVRSDTAPGFDVDHLDTGDDSPPDGLPEAVATGIALESSDCMLALLH